MNLRSGIFTILAAIALITLIRYAFDDAMTRVAQGHPIEGTPAYASTSTADMHPIDLSNCGIGLDGSQSQNSGNCGQQGQALMTPKP